MSIRRRLEVLERSIQPQEFSDWPLEDQLENAYKSLQVHRWGGTRQIATDRQIHCMGLLCALWELPDGIGEHRFPSGAVVTWFPPDSDDLQAVDVSGHIGLEDLPEGVREYWERMEPEKQPERERELYGLYRGEGTS